MKRITTITLLLLLSIGFAFGQSSFLKLIEKGKYPKAEKKIQKAWAKDSNDLGTNYAYALLLSKRKYKAYSCEKAYTFLLKSKQLFEAVTDEKALKKLNKVPINQDMYRNYLDTICRQALEDLSPQNNIDLFQKYLDYYLFAPTKLQQEATDKRDAVAYSDASTKNTVDSYDGFIRNYPNAKQISIAIDQRNALAFKKAQSADQIEDYKSFIKKIINPLLKSTPTQKKQFRLIRECTNLLMPKPKKRILPSPTNDLQMNIATVNNTPKLLQDTSRFCLRKPLQMANGKATGISSRGIREIH